MRASRYLQVARQGKNQVWRYVLGLVLSLVGWQVVGMIPFVVAIAVYHGANQTRPSPDGPFTTMMGDFVLLNVMFWFLIASLCVVIKGLHQRPFMTLVSADRTLSWRRIWQGFLAWGVLLAIATGIDFLLNPQDYQVTFEADRWFLLLPIALILTPIQTTAEELFFRGYLLQGLGQLTQQPFILLSVSGILFTIPHLLNPEIAVHAVLIALNYFVFGVVLTLITLKDDRLELAIGLHAANNLFIALFVNYHNSVLATPSLLTSGALNPLFSLISIVIMSGFFYAIFFR